MRLVSFGVDNYRSLRQTGKLQLDDRLTVLLGPNNEGKSNVLRAINTAMSALSVFSRFPQARRMAAGDKSAVIPIGMLRSYRWERDYPVRLRDQPGDTVFSLEFRLTDLEIAEFRDAVGSNLNGTLPIELRLGQQAANFFVRKQGPGARTLSKKAQDIARFVGQRFAVRYIPAVRTAEAALRTIAELVEEELEAAEQEKEYKEAVEQISKLQQPVLERIAEGVTKTLQEFLPAVRGVQVRLTQEKRYRALRSQAEILINDGDETPLSQKGDGVQSIAAISLVRHVTREGPSGQRLILAIEEPEAHLHPKAMHHFADVLHEISQTTQIILTTHNPIFVQRRRPRCNIIVRSHVAEHASSIAEVRDALGVQVSDNLKHARAVLLVEGEQDRTALRALLTHYAPELAVALANNALAIEPVLGASNLERRIVELRTAACDYHCLLDDDKAGREAFDGARSRGLATPSQATFAAIEGRREAEIEDWYRQALYENWMTSEYGDILVSQHYQGHKTKWTDRVKHAFVKMGKKWTDEEEIRIKQKIADFVSASPADALKKEAEAILMGMIDTLRDMIAD